MELNRWWVDQPAEIFWLEITDRTNLGVDLNAPQRRDDGREFWGYSLINEISDGDIVFHYHKGDKAIVAWSRASGGIWEDTVLWGAHGTAARTAGIYPYLRPGWRHGLEDFSHLSAPVTLAHLRARESDLMDISRELVAAFGSNIYFPVNFYPGSLRPAQGYLTKLPSAVVDLLPPLASAAEEGRSSERAARRPGAEARASTPTGDLGAEYRREDEEIAVGQRDPAEIDPALIERGLRGHRATQNQLADAVRARRLQPRSHRPGEPNFDLAWMSGDNVFVAEVKSTTDMNEEKQLRLGLGQVLRYRQVLALQHSDKTVIAVLVAEREPIDPNGLNYAPSLASSLCGPRWAFCSHEELEEGCWMQGSPPA
jgi:hypothetical protein